MAKSHCGICRFYRGGSCTRVKGDIDPDMWCRLYKPKALATGGSVEDEPESFTQPLFTDKDPEDVDRVEQTRRIRGMAVERRDPGEYPFFPKAFPPEMTPE